ncbi:MAG: hypothetical protein RLW87_01815 [Alphaproteobacteria bacterium]|uniref:hypothetical protein n=1 Tax=Pacificispira sp. TaxID=2888761 RepID=UPI001B2B2F93|nr:hypothetical protein [Alphaproteobacteria bacterium]MEC9267517.1 hypothetical protein [Pseudomonadota bacterium]
MGSVSRLPRYTAALLAGGLLVSGCVTLARSYDVIEEGPASIAFRVTAGGSGIAPVGQQVAAAAARHCAKSERKAVLTERSETSEALYMYYSCRKAAED